MPSRTPALPRRDANDSPPGCGGGRRVGATLRGGSLRPSVCAPCCSCCRRAHRRPSRAAARRCRSKTVTDHLSDPRAGRGAIRGGVVPAVVRRWPLSRLRLLLLPADLRFPGPQPDPPRRPRPVHHRRGGDGPARDQRAPRRECATEADALARSADRVGVARTAHAAVLDPRLGLGAGAVAGDRQGRAACRRWCAVCARRPSASTTTSRICSTRPASAERRHQAARRMGRSRRHRQCRGRPQTRGCSRPSRRASPSRTICRWCRSIPMLIEKALGQLIENAIKIFAAGVDRSRSAPKRRVADRTHRREGPGRLACRRTSTERIWDRFYRSPRHRERIAGLRPRSVDRARLVDRLRRAGRGLQRGCRPAARRSSLDLPVPPHAEAASLEDPDE